jgi:hypothetical protein
MYVIYVPILSEIIRFDFTKSSQNTIYKIVNYT